MKKLLALIASLAILVAVLWNFHIVWYEPDCNSVILRTGKETYKIVCVEDGRVLDVDLGFPG